MMSVSSMAYEEIPTGFVCAVVQGEVAVSTVPYICFKELKGSLQIEHLLLIACHVRLRPGAARQHPLATADTRTEE